MKAYGKGILWDGENNRPLVHFKNDVAEFDDNILAEKLVGLGFVVDDYEPKSDSNSGEINYSDMKRSELFALCKERGITAGATLKSEDLIKLLQDQ